MKRIAVFSFLLVLIVTIFFHYKKDYQTTYSDFGYIALQSYQIHKTGSIQFDYIGSKVDENYDYLPYKFPFIGKYNEKYYLVYPPFYSILISGLHFISEDLLAIYILQTLLFVLYLYCFFRLSELIFEKRYSLLSLLLLFLVSSLMIYIMYIHEYMISHALYIGSLWPFFLHVDQKNSIAINRTGKQTSDKATELSIPFWVLSGLMGGIVVFFRLELGLVYPLLLVAAVFFLKIRIKILLFYWLSSFLLVLFILSLFNYLNFGHPLGLRYILVFEETAQDLHLKYEVLEKLLFNRESGMFARVPLFLVAFLFPLYSIYTRKFYRFDYFLFFLTWAYFILIALTVPNDGGHNNARYFYGLYPLLVWMLIRCIYLETGKIQKTAIVFSLLLGFYSLQGNLATMGQVSNFDARVEPYNSFLRDRPEEYIIYDSKYFTHNNHSLFYDKVLLFVEVSGLNEFFQKNPELITDSILISDFESDEFLQPVAFDLGFEELESADYIFKFYHYE